MRTSCKHELCPHKAVQAQAVVVTYNFTQKHCLAYISSHLPNWEFVSVIVLSFQDASYCKLVFGDSVRGVS
jgi:hypothetical protein